MAPVPSDRSKDVLPTTEALRLGVATPHDPIGDTNYAGKGWGRNVEGPSEELLGSIPVASISSPPEPLLAQQEFLSVLGPSMLSPPTWGSRSSSQTVARLWGPPDTPVHCHKHRDTKVHPSSHTAAGLRGVTHEHTPTHPDGTGHFHEPPLLSNLAGISQIRYNSPPIPVRGGEKVTDGEANQPQPSPGNAASVGNEGTAWDGGA